MSVWCDRTVTGGILFLILFTPFAFGSVHPWAFSIMEALLFLLVVVWMIKLVYIARTGHFEIRNSKFEILLSRILFWKSLVRMKLVKCAMP